MDTALPTPEGTGVSGGDDLRAAAKAMEEAAWREGIDPTGPLGVFVTAMRHAILIMAETGERHGCRRDLCGNWLSGVSPAS